jgi:hypothetical protein
LLFVWQEDLDALQFFASYDIEIKPDNMGPAACALMLVNENLWMGHFEIPRDTRKPRYRHTCLMRGQNKNASSDHLEDLLDISMIQCERYFSLFQLLNTMDDPDDKMLALALMETRGES